MKTTSLNPVAIKDYHINDAFWSAKTETVRTKMIPYQWKALNDEVDGASLSHCIKNFKIAAGMEEGSFYGFVFQDSDLAKWLEAVGYTLIWHKDDELERTADEAIDIIEKAQQPDGYLDTYYIINGIEKRWTNLADNHELYCAGHMIEAGIAYYLGTGKTKLLNIVRKLADCIDATFGSDEGKIHAYPGHQIIEMALVRLSDITKEEKYLKLAEYFINERGKEPLYFAEERKKNNSVFPWKDSLFQYGYYQADMPVRKQQHAEGHAVRAVYMYSGMTDVAWRTGDESLKTAVKRLWEDVTGRQMYITGAIGSSEYGEAFTLPYDLPNDEIYGETCASVALVFWARRMLEHELDGDYADVMERALYNTCMSGASLDGTRFFYVNPLEVDPVVCGKDQRKKHVEPVRQKWFGCACCPPNLARLVASVGNYICGVGENLLAFHLYVGGEVSTPFNGMSIEVNSHMPWDGHVRLKMKGQGAGFTLALRLPGWCGKYALTVNGKEAAAELKQGYLYLQREWKDEDVIEFDMEMRPERNYCHPNVKADLGKTAVSRGPLVYCLEEIDNGKGLTKYCLPAESVLKTVPGQTDEGEIDIEAGGLKLGTDGWDSKLYGFERPAAYEPVKLHFVPYYLWNNRGIGEMTVWTCEK